jgi:hypothetical protein
MKYIDADLLRGKISEQMESLPREVGRGAGTITSKGYGMMEAFQIIRSIIDSLQEEQPSLPSNLDEAAKKYTNDSLNNLGAILRVNVSNAFKAGAEWMAGQGITVDGTFHHSRGYPSVIELKTYIRDYEGADVIVQIRKK